MLKTTKSKSEFKVPPCSSGKNDRAATHGNAVSSIYKHTMLYDYLSRYRQKDQIETLIRKVSMLTIQQQDTIEHDTDVTSKYQAI